MRWTVGNVVKSILFVDANRDDQVQFHPSASRIAVASILDQTFSSPLVHALRKFADKKNRKNTRKKTYRQTARETDIRLDGNVTVSPSPSRVKLVALLDQCHPSLLPVNRFSRKLLASGDLGLSRYCFGVHPDVCLKQNSSLPCAGLVQLTCKTPSTVA